MFHWLFRTGIPASPGWPKVPAEKVFPYFLKMERVPPPRFEGLLKRREKLFEINTL
jgi:hypothetical protein